MQFDVVQENHSVDKLWCHFMEDKQFIKNKLIDIKYIAQVGLCPSFKDRLENNVSKF